MNNQGIRKQQGLHVAIWMGMAAFQIWNHHKEFLNWETLVLLFLAFGAGAFFADVGRVIEYLIKAIFERLKIPQELINTTNEFVMYMVSCLLAFLCSEPAMDTISKAFRMLSG